MSFLGSQKTASNSTHIDSSSRDNRVAAQDSSVLSSGGGNLTNQAGALINSGRGNLNVSSIDPGSFQLASDVAHSAIQSAAASQSAAFGLAQSATTDAQKLAQGGPIGTDWKGLILPLAVVGAVLALIFLPHKGR